MRYNQTQIVKKQLFLVKKDYGGEIFMYCRNCGKEMNDNQAICLACGVPAGKGNSYCPNCGNAVSELAVMCVNCGVMIKEEKVAQPTAIKENASNGVKNLSFIPKFILTGLAILFMFIDGYFIYSTWRGGYYFGSFYQLGNYDWFWYVIPIVLMGISLIMSFIGILKADKRLGTVGAISSVIAFLYSIIAPIIAIDTFYWFNSLLDFGGFDILFYLEILLTALMAVISVFEGIGKPLLKIKDK